MERNIKELVRRFERCAALAHPPVCRGCRDRWWCREAHAKLAVPPA